MTIQGDTVAGSITLTSGSVNFTSSGISLITRGHLPGDQIYVPAVGAWLIIDTITDEDSGTLTDNCPAACAGTITPARLRFQPDGSRVKAEARNLIDLLSGTNISEIAALTLAATKMLGTDGSGDLALFNGATLQALAGLTLAARKIINTAADGTPVLSDISDFVLGMLANADAATVRTTLGALGNTLTGDVDFNGNAIANLKSVNGGPLNGFRNKIINGDFGVAQRGTNFTLSASAYTLDRWDLVLLGGTTATAVQGRLATGDLSIANLSAPYAAMLNYTNGGVAGEGCVFSQHIENVATLAGRRVTVTFWAANGDTSGRKVAVELEQEFLDSGSTFYLTASQVFTLTQGWLRYDAVFDLPAVPAGKTLGASYLAVNFWLSAGSTFASRCPFGHQSGAFNIAHVSIVEGDATKETDPFSPRPIGAELALCQRYYEPCHCRLRGTDNNAALVAPVRFAVPKRITPTLSGVTGTGVQALDATVDGFSLIITGSGVIDTGIQNIKADAEL